MIGVGGKYKRSYITVQQMRHSPRERTCGLSGGRRGWDDLREQR